MRARAFNKVIEFWSTINVPDGYGGNTVNNALITKSWAKVETFTPGGRNSQTTDFGITNTQNAVIITTRKREDIDYTSINQYIMYRGNKYVISTTPTNVNFEDSFIKFIATRQNTKVLDDGDLVKEAQAKEIALEYMIRVNADGGIVDNYDCLVSELVKVL